MAFRTASFRSPSVRMFARLPVLVVALCGLWGCASSGANASSEATSELDVARDAVERAREVGAERGAPTEWRAATSHLLQAEVALSDGDAQRAVRFAREASIDGRLAEATVLASRARARTAVAREVRQLRVEIEGSDS